MRITLAIASFRRPRGLGRLLASLERLTGIGHLGAVELSVLVVDNSPDREARVVVEAAAPGFPFTLDYACEPRRGITHARALAVERALQAGAQFIAFLDDDQLVEPGWLDALVSLRERTGADVVLGAVQPVFVDPPPRWIRDGGFFAFSQHPDGAVIDYGRTGNVLIRAALFEQPEIGFDHRFALTGGEDTLLFEAVRRAGYRIVYSAGAVAHEVIPASRARLSWLVRRWFRTGHIEAELFRRRGAGRGGALINLGRGLLRIGAGGGAFLASGLVLGFGRTHRVVRPLFTLARGCGIVACTLGYRYAEYQRVHGS